jgi:hypothetical protein
MTDYSSILCNERHDRIDSRLLMLEASMKTIQTWLAGVLSALCLNLIGVIVLLLRT